MNPCSKYRVLRVHAAQRRENQQPGHELAVTSGCQHCIHPYPAHETPRHTERGLSIPTHPPSLTVSINYRNPSTHPRIPNSQTRFDEHERANQPRAISQPTSLCHPRHQIQVGHSAHDNRHTTKVLTAPPNREALEEVPVGATRPKLLLALRRVCSDECGMFR